MIAENRVSVYSVSGYPYAALIFITALEEYVYQAFDAGAFHYLIKPVSHEKLASVLQKAAQQYEKTAALKEIRELKELGELKEKIYHYKKKRFHYIGVGDTS